MILASSNILGIAVSDRVITCAQVGGKGDRLSVKKAATFTLPDELILERPQPLGQALAAFLKQQGFSASDAVVGIPARWLIAAEKDVPPSGREQMRTVLRMQGERLPLAEAGELVFDYVGEHDSSKGSKVLLVAMLRKQLERIEQVIEAAGLKLHAVTPTALALSNVAAVKTGAAGQNTSFLTLGRTSAELVYQRSGAPRLLRHVAVATTNGHGIPALGTLGTELRRTVALAPSSPNGDGGGGNEMVVWDGIGLEAAQVAELSERSGMKVRSGNGLAMLGVKEAQQTKGETQDSYAPALALALAGANDSLLPFNFAKSRLAPPPVRRFGSGTVWATVAGSVIVIGLSTLYVMNKVIEHQIAAVEQERTSIKGDVETARDLQARVDFTNLYFDNRSPVLKALREVTNSFRENDPMFASNFIVKEFNAAKEPNILEGTLEGKTGSPQIAAELARRMRENPKFFEVKGPTINPNTSRGGGGTQTFTINFKYRENPVPSNSTNKK